MLLLIDFSRKYMQYWFSPSHKNFTLVVFESK